MALASYTLGSGPWATFGLALPEGEITDAVQVGTLNTQTDVKNTWGDGSIRFAVVTVQNPTAGTHDIGAGSNSASTFTPTNPSASVTFTIGSSTYRATLPSFSASDAWLDGALVREHRYLVTPLHTVTSAAHPLLQVIFDVRIYSDGKYRVDIAAQNTKDISTAASVDYNVSISVGGSTVYSKSSVTHWVGTRWRKKFYSSGFTPATVSPDFTPFWEARAFPKFSPDIETLAYDSTGDIFDWAFLTPYMGTPGGRPEIGAYPWWQAQYSIHKTSDLLDATLFAGDHSGNWSMCITEADGTSIIRLDNYPDYWFDGRATVGHPYGPEIPRDGAFLAGVRPDPAIPDNQHMPSLSFFPYLITGDRWYMDQMRFWAAFQIIYTYPGPSAINGWDFTRGLATGLLAQNGIRGFAWPLRELADCAAYLPDSHPDKSYFETCLANNLEFLEDYALGSDGGLTELPLWEHSRPDSDNNYVISTIWQNCYLAWAIDRAIQHGYGPNGASFRDRVIRCQIKFLSSEADGYPQAYGCPYYPRIGEFDGSGNPVLYTTMQEIWDENYNAAVGTATFTQQPINGYYGPEAYLLTEMGIREGITGAQEAQDWLFAHADDDTGIQGDLEERGGFFALFDSDTESAGVDSFPPIGTLAFSGYIPALDVSIFQYVSNPPAGIIVASGNSPSLLLEQKEFIIPVGIGSASIVGLSPSANVLITNDADIAVATAILQASGIAPDISVAAIPIDAAIGVGAVSITGQVPFVEELQLTDRSWKLFAFHVKPRKEETS